MGKYIKYEIKGSYKFILGILAIVLIASSIIQFSISGNIENQLPMSSSSISGFTAFMIGLSILVIFGGFLTAFIYIIGSFRKELYEDRGYLTFTLPLTGNQILGGKFIVAILWHVVLGISIAAYNILLAIILFGSYWSDIVIDIFHLVDYGVLSFGIVSILSAIMTLILIYFSIALSRVSIRNKKVGSLWFIIFLILNALAGYFVFKSSTLIPYFLNLDSFKILHFSQLNLDITGSFNSGIGDMIIFGNNYQAYINISGILSHVLISVLAFLATGYLIEKKIDL